MTFFSRDVTAQFVSGTMFSRGISEWFFVWRKYGPHGNWSFWKNIDMKKMVLNGKFHLFYVYCQEIITLIGCLDVMQAFTCTFKELNCSGAPTALLNSIPGVWFVKPLISFSHLYVLWQILKNWAPFQARLKNQGSNVQSSYNFQK